MAGYREALVVPAEEGVWRGEQNKEANYSTYLSAMEILWKKMN